MADLAKVGWGRWDTKTPRKRGERPSERFVLTVTVRAVGARLKDDVASHRPEERGGSSSSAVDGAPGDRLDTAVMGSRQPSE